jgi:hypothetical protein
MPHYKTTSEFPVPRALPGIPDPDYVDELRRQGIIYRPETRPRPFETQFLTRISRKGLPCVEDDGNLTRDEHGNFVGHWVKVKTREQQQRERKLFPERFRVIRHEEEEEEYDDEPPTTRLHSLRR